MDQEVTDHTFVAIDSNNFNNSSPPTLTNLNEYRLNCDNRDRQASSSVNGTPVPASPPQYHSSLISSTSSTYPYSVISPSLASTQSNLLSVSQSYIQIAHHPIDHQNNVDGSCSARADVENDLTKGATDPSSPAYSLSIPLINVEEEPLNDNRQSKEKSPDNDLPPPAYTENKSPIDSFTFIMSMSGGAASVLTQVQQSAPAPLINGLGGKQPSNNVLLAQNDYAVSVTDSYS